jgi:hypothetical protein
MKAEEHKERKARNEFLKPRKTRLSAIASATAENTRKNSWPPKGTKRTKRNLNRKDHKERKDFTASGQ